MDIDLAQKAISAALAGNWKEAIKLNKQILKDNSKDVDSLNRLARAYSETGNIKKAKALAEKVLKLDPFNKIAEKALKKWKGVRAGEIFSVNVSGGEAFLEEPGKTKILPLIHIGAPTVMSKLDPGEEVRLTLGSHRVSVVTPEGKYIGRLPDDLSARLRQLIKMGNEYQVLIKSVDPENVKVFIREVKRSEKLGDISSFPTEKIEYISFTPPELVRKKEPGPLDVEDEE